MRCPHGLSGWTNEEGVLIIQHGSNPEARLVLMDYRPVGSSSLTRDFQKALQKTLEWARRACEHEGVHSEAMTLQEEYDARYAFVIDTLIPRETAEVAAPRRFKLISNQFAAE